jgi:hypothetical protein
MAASACEVLTSSSAQRSDVPHYDWRDIKNIGDTYSRNDFQSASIAYEAAAKKYFEVGPKSPISQKGIERCEQKIEAIRMKEQNPEVEVSLPINQIF